MKRARLQMSTNDKQVRSGPMTELQLSREFGANLTAVR
jgi:hypothetical protein